VHDVLDRAKVPHLIQNVGPMISIFLTTGPIDGIHEYRDVRRYCDFAKYIRLQHKVQRSGVYYHPNQFEPLFLSTAHTSEDISLALDRLEQAVAGLDG